MKILQLPNIGNGGRMGNCLFTIASTIGLALRHGYTPRFPADWKYRDRFNIPDEWFGNTTFHTISNVKEKSYEFDENIELDLKILFSEPYPSRKVSILDSYLQSPLYWKGYEAEICQYLTPKGCNPGTREGVAIHYRRGDYVGNPNYYQLEHSYYTRAYVEHFNGWDITAFSDDPAFIQHIHPGHNYHDDDPISELARMAEYKGHITANSTFSWWGAYLSGGKVVRPNEWFAGPLLTSCSVRDLFPTEWIEGGEAGQADLQDITFIIPVQYDHSDRIENLGLCLRNLRHFFNTNIIVGEIDTDQFNSDMRFNYGTFHRTRALNEMTKAAKTPYVVNYDADVILMPWQIIEMANRLRNGADLVYPYDGRFAGVDRSLKDTDPYCTQWIGVNHRQMMSMAPLPVIGVPGSVGGAVGFNKKRYLNIGGENENFISWGPEDVERYWRASLFGYRIERTPGTLYHIDHWRGDNSEHNTVQSHKNHAYWDRLQRMTKEQVMEHLGLVNHDERGYPGGWKLEDGIKEHAFSLELAYHIHQLIKDYTTVYDLGSGPGFYARFLSQRGMDVLAVDAGDTRDISLFPAACLDITTMQSPARDVVLCLEVGEHVPREQEQALLDSICRHAIHIVILSWAIPGQGGFGHVNNASNAYVIEEMRIRGWAYLPEPSQYLRERCSGADWFGETVMVFNKGGVA